MKLYYAGARPVDFKTLPGLPSHLLLSYHDIAMPAGWYIQKTLLESVLASRGKTQKVVVRKKVKK